VNAVRFMPVVEATIGETPWYVEGLVVLPDVGTTIGHAWLETHDGRIVDVTLNWKQPNAETLARMTFHTALRRFSLSEVLAHTRQRGATLPIARDELTEAGGVMVEARGARPPLTPS
jgi:hypothetical protein